MSVRQTDLPPDALLMRYAESGAYTDCFVVKTTRPVSLEEFIEAFYTTPVFRLERIILWLVRLPSTDGQARALARGERDLFAAWVVELREAKQILLDAGRTRSWLSVGEEGGDGVLYFGSAVVPNAGRGLPKRFRGLLGLHRVYSRILLAAAARRLGVLK